MHHLQLCFRTSLIRRTTVLHTGLDTTSFLSGEGCSLVIGFLISVMATRLASLWAR